MKLEDIMKIDSSYYGYLKQLLVAAPAKEHLTDSEKAMLDGIITAEECFMLEVLCHA